MLCPLDNSCELSYVQNLVELQAVKYKNGEVAVRNLCQQGALQLWSPLRLNNIFNKASAFSLEGIFSFGLTEKRICECISDEQDIKMLISC